VIASLHEAARLDEGVPVRYPGEQTIATRRRNLAEGVPVDEAIWKRVLAKDSRALSLRSVGRQDFES
jgi:3-dehydro-L-gulonate 2-dehydrogenase